MTRLACGGPQDCSRRISYMCPIGQPHCQNGISKVGGDVGRSASTNSGPCTARQQPTRAPCLAHAISGQLSKGFCGVVRETHWHANAHHPVEGESLRGAVQRRAMPRPRDSPSGLCHDHVTGVLASQPATSPRQEDLHLLKWRTAQLVRFAKDCRGSQPQRDFLLRSLHPISTFPCAGNSGNK